MSAKSLLQKLKSIFGLSGGGRDSDSRRSGRDTTNVTVEREPDTASEDAVKGTGTAQGNTETMSGTETAASADSTDSEAGTDGESIENVKGIGPTYRDRLEAAGIETVAELAESDPAKVAEAAQTSESRAGNWVERAQNR